MPGNLPVVKHTFVKHYSLFNLFSAFFVVVVLGLVWFFFFFRNWPSFKTSVRDLMVCKRILAVYYKSIQAFCNRWGQIVLHQCRLTIEVVSLIQIFLMDVFSCVSNGMRNPSLWWWLTLFGFISARPSLKAWGLSPATC